MKQNLLKTMLVMAGIVTGSMGAWADTVVLNPTQTTVIHGNDKNDNTLESKVYYDVNATTWSCSFAKISGGAFTNAVKDWGWYTRCFNKVRCFFKFERKEFEECNFDLYFTVYSCRQEL